MDFQNSAQGPESYFHEAETLLHGCQCQCQPQCQPQCGGGPNRPEKPQQPQPPQPPKPEKPQTSIDEQAVDAIAISEARIAAIMACFLESVFEKISEICQPAQQVELARVLLSAYACKEKGMADVINALANKITADKGSSITPIQC